VSPRAQLVQIGHMLCTAQTLCFSALTKSCFKRRFIKVIIVDRGLMTFMKQ